MDLRFSETDPTPERLRAIAALYARVWPNSSEQHLDKALWAFSGNPVGRAPLIVVTPSHEDEVLGVRGGIAWRMLSPTGPAQRCIQLHGTAVHPKVRRQGVFTLMTEKFIDLAQESNFAFIFNVSVDASRAGYEKLGWSYTSTFRRLTLPRRPIMIAKAIARSPQNAAQEVPPGDSAPDFADILPLITRRDRTLDQFYRTDYCDEAFFRWRFGAQQYSWYGSPRNGFIVYRIRRQRGLTELLIGDVWPHAHSLERLVLSAMRRVRPDMVTCWISAEHPFYMKFRRIGFFSKPGSFLNLGFKPIGPAHSNADIRLHVRRHRHVLEVHA